jgi:hypothetical protein
MLAFGAVRRRGRQSVRARAAVAGSPITIEDLAAHEASLLARCARRSAICT